MIVQAWIAILICMAVVSFVLIHTRNSRASIGLPFAYIISLVLIHVPGAYAYVVSGGSYTGKFSESGEPVAWGIIYAAVGCVCFLLGMLGYRSWSSMEVSRHRARPLIVDRDLMFFCLFGGWGLVFLATPLLGIPTLGAIINFGGAIWMLGIMLGMIRAIQGKNHKNLIVWTLLLLVYPVYMLMFGGFLSYGSNAIIIVLSLVVVRIRTSMTLVVALFLGVFLGMSVFVNYFESRDSLRDVVWSGSGVTERANAVARTFSDFEFFNTDNPDHLDALAERLNQNEFVGITKLRLDRGTVEYLNGRSFVEGVASVVPRAIWPNKPVYGGSGTVVSEMTGLFLSKHTSWGVGNVMEFYINFGLISLVGGFLVLGWLIAWLDFATYRELVSNRYGLAFLYFLPGVALIQPNGSMVELVGGSVSAWLAGYLWLVVWSARRTRSRSRPIQYA